MQVFHTSPTEISKITEAGRFGSFLFFSGRVYQMTAGEATVYSLEIDDDEIIEAGQLFYHEAADARMDIDEATAEDLIEESQQVHGLDGIDMEDAADLSWDVQHFTARAARILGFRGVAVSDEQGTAYLIDMLGRENELVRE